MSSRHLRIVGVLVFFFSGWVRAQNPANEVEIPRISIVVNQIQNIPIEGYRNSTVINSNIIEIQPLPNDQVQIKGLSSGSTIVYIWDAMGRKTFQIDVLSRGSIPSITNRPGYDPNGSEFIYRLSMLNQLADTTFLSPFWTQEFSSSVPIRKTDEWRSNLLVSTNPTAFTRDYVFSPFSEYTYVDQIFTQYRSSNYSVAAGDVNFNAGELSVIGFPFRGGSFQLFDDSRNDQIHFFGGLDRPQFQTRNLFNEPSSKLYGFAGTKEIFSNLLLKSSFVYLQQSPTSRLFPLITTFKDDFVADLGFVAQPFTDELSFEGEYGRSADDNSFRSTLEYRPFWGRIFVGYKQIGAEYVQPANFFMLRNYRETSFITDVKPLENLSFTVNYQVSNFGADPIIGSTETTFHRTSLINFFKRSELTSFINGIDFSWSVSELSPQNFQRVYTTYQHAYEKSNNLLFMQMYVLRTKSTVSSTNIHRVGPGVDSRFTWVYQPRLQFYFQNQVEFAYVNSTRTFDTTNPEYFETIFGIGPNVSYEYGRTLYTAGIFENLNIRDFSDIVTNQFQPYVSVLYTPSQAISLGCRMLYNTDFQNNFSNLQSFLDLIYRFGSRVPDTLLSTLSSSAQIEGWIFLDDNGDGQYQLSETLVEGAKVSLNKKPAVNTNKGKFVFRTNPGENVVTVTLPEKYKNFQFATDNPGVVRLTPSEKVQMYFGISQKLILAGKVEVVSQSDRSDAKGFAGATVTITGENYEKSFLTAGSGGFYAYVPKPGKYKIRLHDIEFPPGYRILGDNVFEIETQEMELNKIPTFVVQARRRVVGRAFLDRNSNGVFDDVDDPLPGITVYVGKDRQMSDTDGSFLFEDLQPGVLPVRVPLANRNGSNLNLPDNKITIPEAGTVELMIPYQR